MNRHRSGAARLLESCRVQATRTRGGFTLIEVLIAITILAGVVLTMAMNTVLSARSVGTSSTRNRAQAMVDQQISRARTWPTYNTIGELMAPRFNTAQIGLTLSTTVQLDSTAGNNITFVTVTVMGDSPATLPLPIRRSIAIAAP